MGRYDDFWVRQEDLFQLQTELYGVEERIQEFKTLSLGSSIRPENYNLLSVLGGEDNELGEGPGDLLSE